jgi:hypothetical protein
LISALLQRITTLRRTLSAGESIILKQSTKERCLIAAVSYTPPSTTLAPGPGAGGRNPKAAIRRCLAAWQSGYKASQKKSGRYDDDDIFAAQDAGNCYCNAMPILSGQDGVRDFIACAAHGILIGAISPERSGQILYAAQVALSIVQSERKSKSTTPETPTPPPPKTPAFKKNSRV